MGSSYFVLYIRAKIVKLLTGLFMYIDLNHSAPKPDKYTSKIKIPSLTASQKGSIDLLFYEPKSVLEKAPRPVVIDFHGGGWIFGGPEMDARWASRVVETGATLISVGYRLAPKYAFPTPIDDCVDAIVWVYENAETYGFDKNKIVLSGFSAGGNMVFAAAMKMYLEVQQKLPLAGIISIYPLLDRSITEVEKAALNPEAVAHDDRPKHWEKLFTDCYLYSSTPIEMANMYLSPALASDEIIEKTLPSHISIYTVSWDTLMDEGERFRERLAKLGKTTSGRVITDVKHAFDRYPTYGKGNPKMDEMYTAAVADLKSML